MVAVIVLSGEPLTVTTPAEIAAVTPGGRPVDVIVVAPVTVYVIFVIALS